ncbi:uncharacterized protein PFLUO_LOCUS3451 [Penicillium psychrofluorescens]|uniref:uncharacterized protein n=1 Tax=Penicillium psychrofluorescens TaxID=3158075 RepID=UPI003CCDA5C9
MAIRGGDSGGLDGIDVWSTNMWIHDIEVTNKDECVTVKSTDTDISDITYRNIYTWSSNQMYMIKSYGGNGTVSNVLLENFIGHGNAYSLDIDQYWSSMSEAPGDGIQLNNVTISNWKGTESDGAERGPIRVAWADAVPCTDVTIEDFAMWTEEGSTQWYSCESGYGSGFCLDTGDDYTSYTTTMSVTAAPSGYSAPTMASDLATAFGTAMPIPVPAIPTSFYPGATPYSKLAGAKSSSASRKSSTYAARRW